MKNKLTFNEFCEEYLDKLYDSRFEFEEQCSGYKQLRRMVEQGITPATKEATKRWEKYPSELELGQIPDDKYMRSLHPMLKETVRDNWYYIKKLEI